MKSILETLDVSTIETLLSWCEDHPYTEVKELAAKPPSEGGLGLNISVSTLCRLYTSHGIADSKEARAQYAASLGLDANGNNKSLLDAAQDQLELRILELASRPNPSVSELRLLSQSISRLRSLQLGERRVQVAEKRETRLATPPAAPQEPKLLSPAEIKHRVRVFLGKEQPRDFDEAELTDTPHLSHDTTNPPPSESNPNEPTSTPEETT